MRWEVSQLFNADRAALQATMASSECAADRLIRRRAVPLGTVGYRMAGIISPACSSLAEAASVASFSPMMTGMMGVVALGFMVEMFC